MRSRWCPTRPRAATAGTLLAFALAPLVWAGPATAQTRVDRRTAVDPDAYIKIVNLSGSVGVTGWERDTLAVTGTVEEEADFYFGGRGAAAKLGVFHSGKGPSPAGRLEVRVPAGSTVWIKTADAPVTVEGVTGGIDVYSVSGGIRVSGAPRSVYAESMAGSVEIDATAPSVRARTASGRIRFGGSTRDLSLSTVAGGMRVATSALDRGRFETVTGDIVFEGAVNRGGSLDFESHGGRVDLHLPPGLDADFAVRTYEGEIRNELQPERRPVPRPLEGRELAFLNGNGGAQVSVETFSGDVLLRAK